MIYFDFITSNIAQLLPGDVDLLKLITAGQDPGPRHPPHHVDPGTLEEGLGSFPGHQLPRTGKTRLVLDFLTRRHHHPPLDGIEGVGRDAGHDGDDPAKEEGVDPVGVGREHWRMIELFLSRS